MGAAVFLEGDVEIGAAETEGADATAAGRAGGLDPRAAARAEIERAPGESEFRIRLGEIGGGRDRLVAEGERYLDEAGGAGGALGVADLRFHRAEGAPVMTAGGGSGENFLERGDFAEVAGGGAGAVGFDEANGGGRVASELVATGQRDALTLGTRRVDALGATVGRGAETADDGVDFVAVAFGVFEPANDEHAAAFAHHGAIGRGGEWSAFPGRRHGGRLRETHIHENRVQRIDAAGDHAVGGAELELAEAEVEGGEGAGAGGIGDAVGAAEVEAVGDAASDDVAETAGEGALVPIGEERGDFFGGGLDLWLGNAGAAHALDPHGT